MLRFVDEVTDVEDTRAFIPVASQSICLAHQYERLYGMLVKALPTMETMANFGGKRCQGVMPRARSETLPSGVKETSAIRLLISTIERLQRSHQLPPHVLRQVRDQQQPTGDDGVPGIRPRLRSAYSNPGMTMLDDVQSTLDGPNRKWGSDLRLSDLQTDNDRKPEYQRLSTKRSSSLRINTQDQHQPKGREERATDPSSRSVSSTHEGPGDRELPSTPAGHFNKPKTSPLIWPPGNRVVREYHNQPESLNCPSMQSGDAQIGKRTGIECATRTAGGGRQREQNLNESGRPE